MDKSTNKKTIRPRLLLLVLFLVLLSLLCYFTCYTRRYAFDEVSGNSVEVTYYLLHARYTAVPIAGITFDGFNRLKMKLLWRNREKVSRIIWGTDYTYYTQDATEQAHRLERIIELIGLFKNRYGDDFRRKCEEISEMSTNQINHEIDNLSAR
jgi:hypothetical protein